METRVAIIAVIIEKEDSIMEVYKISRFYSEYLIGRMGIPYRKRGIQIMSIAMEAPHDIISELNSKLGIIEGVNVRTAYSKIKYELEDQMINN